MRQNQIFFKTPHNSYGQMAPRGYANNQRAPQKSSLELLMENYVANQSKQLQSDRERQGEIGSDEPQSEKAKGENEKPFVSPPHEPKIPLTQEFAQSKLDEQFRNFIKILPIKLPPKLTDPESSSIPCVIGSETIKKATYDLGENVSLMPLSLCERLGIGQRNLLLTVKLMTLNERFVGGNPCI